MKKKLHHFLYLYLLSLIFAFLPITLFAAPENPLKKESHFTILIAAHNNEVFNIRALESILQQTYKNYAVVFIDDGSSDHTKEKVEQFLLQKDKEKKICFLSYRDAKGLLERLYTKAQESTDNDILIFLDEKASLSHAGVLQELNQLFQQKNCYLAYSQYQEENGKKGKCKSISPSNLFTYSARGKFWNYSPMKAFYASLFKKIKLEDFFYKGKFLSHHQDACYMFPLIEMAKEHKEFADRPLCFYQEPPKLGVLSDLLSYHKTMAHIRSLKPYKPIATLSKEKAQSPKTDLVIFSYHRPLQLYAFLESTKKYVKNLSQISVIYRSDTPRYCKAYEEIQRTFPEVTFFKQGKNPKEDFKPLTLQALAKGSSPYILFAVDDLIFKDFVDLQECIDSLETTQAFFFSLRLGSHIDYHYMQNCPQKIPHSVAISPTIMGWQLKHAEYDWCYPTSVDVTLYRKKAVQKAFATIDYHNPNTLEILWHEQNGRFIKPREKKLCGLCFNSSKAVNFALNQVNVSENRYAKQPLTPEELLEKFETGWKIDIAPFEKMRNRSPHMETELNFVKRTD